jgi:hypothetical protein
MEGEDEVDALNFLFSEIYETQDREDLEGLVNNFQSSLIDTSSTAFSIASLMSGAFIVALDDVEPYPFTEQEEQ